MENVEIAHLLNKYADLLEIQGADLFRIQAYRNAARTIESHSQPIVQLLEQGHDLKKLKLPGIGKSMAEHIEEIVKTGTLLALKELSKELPDSLDELLEIEGLGPKRTKRLYEKLGVSSIKKLKQAIDSGKLESLGGFGKKSIDKIRQAIDNMAKGPSASNFWTPISWCIPWSNICARAVRLTSSKWPEVIGAGWRPSAISTF